MDSHNFWDNPCFRSNHKVLNLHCYIALLSSHQVKKNVNMALLNPIPETMKSWLKEEGSIFSRIFIIYYFSKVLWSHNELNSLPDFRNVTSLCKYFVLNGYQNNIY